MAPAGAATVAKPAPKWFRVFLVDRERAMSSGIVLAQRPDVSRKAPTVLGPGTTGGARAYGLTDLRMRLATQPRAAEADGRLTSAESVRAYCARSHDPHREEDPWP